MQVAAMVRPSFVPVVRFPADHLGNVCSSTCSPWVMLLPASLMEY